MHVCNLFLADRTATLVRIWGSIVIEVINK